MMWQHLKNVFLTIVAISASFLLLLFAWWKPDVVSTSYENDRDIRLTEKENSNLIVELNLLAKGLEKIRQQHGLPIAVYDSIGLEIQTVVNIVRRLEKNVHMKNYDVKHSSNRLNQESQKRHLQEVCPEEYKGKALNYGFPVFRKGFGTADCKDFVPVEKLVTLLLTIQAEPIALATETQLDVLKNVARYFPNIKVILATEKPLLESVQTAVSKFNISFESYITNGDNISALWKRLVDKVKTSYILLAPDITYFDDDINLERLVRILSYKPDILIAGGAHRNSKGEWDIGCQQVTFRNWTASYKGGYYRSYNDCVICDYISGPFVTKKTTLEDLPLDINLHHGVFRDLFWRIQHQKFDKIVVSCPDVMFNIRDREVKDEIYLPFAQKYDIHRIVEPNGRVRWYGCRNGYPYISNSLCSREKGLSLSPASMENLADAIKFFMKACEETGALCEFIDGTEIGAVKFNGVLPWDIDGDIAFHPANFSVIGALKGKLQKAGYTLSVGYGPKIVNGKPSGGYFALKTGKWNIELWGQESNFESPEAAAPRQVRTKIHFAGQWVNSPRNPGLYVRNHFGAGTYKHAEHWRHHGRTSSWSFYTNAGFFTQCPKPGHSACLDQYPADGNLYFRNYPC